MWRRRSRIGTGFRAGGRNACSLFRREREQDPTAGSALLPERIGDAPHLPGPIHQQHIEPHPGPAPFGMLAHYECRRGQQPCLLPCAECSGSARQSWTVLHLNEGQKPCTFRNKVNLPGWGPHSPGQDLPAIGSQRRFRRSLRVHAAALRRPTPGSPGGGQDGTRR